MSSSPSVLQLRNALKKKKPVFRKTDAHKCKKLEANWRQPRGRHSKYRLKLKSRPRQPSIGFSSPKEVRFFTADGYPLLLVYNSADLGGVKTPITIASGVGTRKRIEIIKKAKELHLSITNVKDGDVFVKNVEDMLKQKKERKKKVAEKRQQLKETAAKKEAEKEEKAEQETVEDREKREKELKRKVLEQG